jgi:hypothetical protein
MGLCQASVQHLATSHSNTHITWLLSAEVCDCRPSLADLTFDFGGHETSAQHSELQGLMTYKLTRTVEFMVEVQKSTVSDDGVGSPACGVVHGQRAELKVY